MILNLIKVRIGIDLGNSTFRKILIIGVSLAALQQLVGINVVIYYANSLFTLIAPETNPFALAVVIGLVNFLSTFIAVKYVDKWGRIKMMKVGLIFILISMITLGIGIWSGLTGAWMAILIVAYIISFACTIGPIIWIYIAEIAPNRIRGSVVSISIMALWIANIIVSQSFPVINENSKLLTTFNGSFPFFLYALFATIMLLLVMRLPETKGKTLEEIGRDLEK